MNVSLSELLSLVGRLDSAPGFDAPRERYRRFLLEHVTDVPTSRSLIEECQRSVGEQRHRALQDLVVLVGRFLGFETIFGSYERIGGHVDGQWRSRGLLDVVLEIRTEQPLNRVGVRPDETVELSIEDLQSGRDAQLDRATAYLRDLARQPAAAAAGQ